MLNNRHQAKSQMSKSYIIILFVRSLFAGAPFRHTFSDYHFEMIIENNNNNQHIEDSLSTLFGCQINYVNRTLPSMSWNEIQDTRAPDSF